MPRINCNFIISDRFFDEFLRWMISLEEPKNYTCSECTYFSETKVTLRRHMKSTHNKTSAAEEEGRSVYHGSIVSSGLLLCFYVRAIKLGDGEAQFLATKFLAVYFYTNQKWKYAR